ncbi:ATP-binding protein [Actinoallomurus acanthiterrae]
MTHNDAVLADRLLSLPSARFPVRALPEYAGRAREFAKNTVTGFPHDPYEVALITSEIVTNAICATAALRNWPDDVFPIDLNVIVTDRYVHLAVTDPVTEPMPAREQGGLLANNGRGLLIVDQHALDRWVTYAEDSKTVHVIVPAPEVALTPAELHDFRRP